MEIRDAAPADVDELREVHRKSIQKLGPEAYDQQQVTAWADGCEAADYTAAIKADSVEFVVAERDDAVVGFGTLRLAPPDDYEASADAEVTGVYVHPSVARDGVGTRIYTELEQLARETGVQTLGLSASLNAVPFYDSHGYTRVRTYTHEFSSHISTGVTGEVVEMTKEL